MNVVRTVKNERDIVTSSGALLSAQYKSMALVQDLGNHGCFLHNHLVVFDSDFSPKGLN